MGERVPEHYQIVYTEMELGSSTALSVLANWMTTFASIVEAVAFCSPHFFFRTQNQRREIGIRRVARSQAKTSDPAEPAPSKRKVSVSTSRPGSVTTTSKLPMSALRTSGLSGIPHRFVFPFTTMVH